VKISSVFKKQNVRFLIGRIEKAMHYQFNPFEESADGGVEGTEVKPG
jgi:hypothetical protein